jgi:DNA-binding transcriptional MerR regulator
MDWVGWLKPRLNGGGERFSEGDLARVRLIRDLKKDMGVNDEGITVILDLVDQIHGLRGVLRELLSAIYAHSGTIAPGVTAGRPEATNPDRTDRGSGQVPSPRSDAGGSW